MRYTLFMIYVAVAITADTTAAITEYTVSSPLPSSSPPTAAAIHRPHVLRFT